MQLNESLAAAAVSVVLLGLDPDTGQPLTHRRESDILRRASALDPKAIPTAIQRLQAQITLLSAYVEEPSDAD